MRFLICLLLLAILLFASPVFSYNDQHYNAGTLTKSETATQVTYKWTLTIPALGDTIGDWHSRPMFIADCNAVDGYVYGVGTAGAGTEDHNLLYHFSYDNSRNYWFGAVTPHNFDALGGTAVHDTIGIESTANVGAFHNGIWFVLEYSGQASNESNRAFTFVATFTKDLTLTDNAASPRKLARTATGSGTNP